MPGNMKKPHKLKEGMTLSYDKSIATLGDDIIVVNEASEAADHEELLRLKFEKEQFLVPIIDDDEENSTLVAAMGLRDAQIEDLGRELEDSRFNVMVVDTSFVHDASGQRRRGIEVDEQKSQFILRLVHY